MHRATAQRAPLLLGRRENEPDQRRKGQRGEAAALPFVLGQLAADHSQEAIASRR